MPNTKPFVGAALLCEYLLQEKDDVLTAVRIVDIFAVHPPPGNLPPGVVGLPSANFSVLVTLKSGDLRGEFRMALKLRSPSGKTQNVSDETPVVLNGGEHGVNYVAKLTLAVKEYGLHWFDVYWEGEVLTSIPLRLVEAAAQKEPAPETN